MAVDVKVPNIGESVTEVTISGWTKQEGDYVEMDEVICEIESDKATFELNAEDDGVLHIAVDEGETVSVGDKVASIDTEVEAPAKSESKDSGDAAQAEQPASEQEEAAASAEPEGKKTYATGTPSPAAKKLLDENGVKAEDVKGTGKDGRITKEDVQKAIAAKSEPSKKESDANQEAPAKEEPAQTPEKDQSEELGEAPQPKSHGVSRESRKEKMTTLRKTIANKMVSAKNETAMLTTFNEVDMTNLMDLRKKYKDPFKEKYDVNLGFMSFFAKAVCLAAQEFPSVNAKILDEEATIQYHDYVDLGIAVSTPRGLVVPNIRNAESMSFDEIESSVVHFAKKARDNKIGIDEMQGGTFTITNGGIFGSMLSTPILNTPQSAILGMHNIVERPVAINGEVAIRPIMYLALSYDHRLVDGKESVSFLYRIKDYIEDPTRLLLGV